MRKRPKNIKIGIYTPKMTSRPKPKVWAKTPKIDPKWPQGDPQGGSKMFFVL